MPTGSWGHVQHMVCQVGRSFGHAAAFLRCSVSVLRKVVVAERLSVLSHRCYHVRAQTHHETIPDVCTSLPHSVIHSRDCWCNLSRHRIFANTGHFFRAIFLDFCKGLVRASRLECCKLGQQFLSHREGLHAALSGKHFLDTLARPKNRNALWRIGEKWGAAMQEAFSSGGRVKASKASQVFALGDCLTTLALAEHTKKERCMGKHNKTHTLPTFQVKRHVTGSRECFVLCGTSMSSECMTQDEHCQANKIVGNCLSPV